MEQLLVPTAVEMLLPGAGEAFAWICRGQAPVSESQETLFVQECRVPAWALPEEQHRFLSVPPNSPLPAWGVGGRA